ncbi:hypothetical protein SNE40_000621 [Patella caerulea]|uniref:P-type domain-containing protein n=1 Tax=Patella caerulea TaxID=87958 RepID=A0AAN8KB84_PATCE
MEQFQHESSSKVTFTRNTRRPKLVVGLIVITVLAVAVIVGLVVYFNTNNEVSDTKQAKDKKSNNQDQIHNELIDCHPEKGASQNSCSNRGCIWAEQKIKGAPWCIYPESHGYLIDGDVTMTARGQSARLHRIKTDTIYGGEIFEKLLITVEYQTENRLRVKIVPNNVTRYEIPPEALNITASNTLPDLQLYDVTLIKGPPQFGIVIKRKGTNTTVFSTDLPGMTYSDQFIQITTRLPSDNLYGFGEHNHRRFRHDMNWKTWSIFTRDIGAVGPENLYGAHPVYMNLENDGKASVVLLKNTNAMEIVLQPSPNPAITYRVIGGILDFYIFMGPSPEQAVQQYIQAIGRPVMPPYWSLGYHLCRWGYKDIEDMKMVINRTRAAGIPYDVQWGDIEYMFKKYAFTYDRKDWSGLPEIVQDLHTNNMKFVVILDPGIGANRTIINEAAVNSPGYNMFDDGVQQDVFIKNASDNVLIAKVWPGLTAYPDFTKPATEEYWLKWMRFFYENESIQYDSLWIDMNEPSSFVPGSIYGCDNTSLDYPPYVPKIAGSDYQGRMFDKTLCMTSLQNWGRHYDVHSLYGHSMSIQTHNALIRQKPGLRPWTMTRSSFVGTGKYATKWMGDNQSKWPQMHWSIIGIMEFSMFGFAMNGADICGFWFEAEYEMCLRWHQLGAFYPFARNHNGKGDYPELFKHQDPAAWDQRFVDIVKPVLMTRYRLLPYLYTLMYKAHEEGHMVMKAMLFEFVDDKNTWSIDRQFLLGPALLISPALEQNQTIVEAYFPKARWYDYTSGEEIMVTGTTHSLYTPIDKFNLHIRGGHVIPWQEPATTTFESRKNPMGIIIALDENYLANGELFLDDGESLETHMNGKSTVIKFSMNVAGLLTITPVVHNYQPADNLRIRTIEIYGLTRIPYKVVIDGVRIQDSKIRQSGKIIQILTQNITITQSSTIEWMIC